MSVDKKRQFDPLDWIMLAGVVLLTGGVGWIYAPAAPILLGLVLVIFSWVMSHAKG